MSNELSTEKTMTTKELAEVLNVDVKTIQRASAKLFDPSTLMSKVVNGGKSFIFNEAQVTAIKLELQNHSRVNSLTPKTNLEKQLLIQQAMKIQEEIIKELQTENEQQKQQLIEQAPKVEFFDDVTGSSDTIDMKEVAKILNIKGLGRNNLFEFLRKESVLDRNNQPYQKYVDAEYFRIIESRFTLPTGEIKISLKTVVFQKGLDFIRKLIKARGISEKTIN